MVLKRARAKIVGGYQVIELVYDEPGLMTDESWTVYFHLVELQEHAVKCESFKMANTIYKRHLLEFHEDINALGDNRD